MNINTSALLGMLAPKLTNVAKQNIEKASVDGKVNLNEVIKDQSVRSVLNNLMQDVAVGTKSKENVLNLLENSKQSLTFKNFSGDIKTVIKLLENSPELQKNTQLMNQVALLKNSMLDLGKMDSKSLMNSLSNSGIFLESKLLQQSIPISDIVSKAIDFLSKNLQNFNTEKLATLPSQITKLVDLMTMGKNIPQNLQAEIKTAVSNLLTEFSKNILSSPLAKTQVQGQAQTLEQIQNNAKPQLNALVNLIETKLPSSDNKTQLINNLQSLFTNLQTLSTNEKASLITTIGERVLHTVSSKEIPNDIKLEVKNAVANLLRPVQTPVSLLQNFQASTVLVEQKLAQALPNMQPNSNLSLMLSELNTILKENFALKENLPVLKNIFSMVMQKVDGATLEEQVKTGLKQELQNLSSQLKSSEGAKTPEAKAQTLQNVFENLKTFSTKLETAFAKLAANQMDAIPKNLANDLKGIVLQIQEQIENSKEPVTKELRAIVDKIGTQVEFFQLLSYTSNSNHTILSFIQDNIEDSDIKFHKTDDETFSCQINLNLKDHGELKVLLVLDKFQNLGINIGVESDNFKQKVQENLPNLRSKINSVGLLLQALNVFNIDSTEISGVKQLKGYQQSDNLSFGVDLTV